MLSSIKFSTSKATAEILPWLLSFDDSYLEQTIAGLNRDTSSNATLSNLYEQDKEAIQTGFAITKGLSQNFNTFMNIMASDMDNAGKQAATDVSGKPILDANGKPMTVKQAYDQGYEVAPVTVDGQTINYATRQQLWGSGGTGNIIATALIGAASGNVTGGAGELVKNTAINVVRAYGATEIKQIADEFMDVKDGKLQANGTSETVRGLLHAIAGCAGASATGGSCADAAVASGGTVAMNNALGALLNLDPSTMTEAQKQAYSNLMGTLVSGVTSAVGGDAAVAQLATKIEEDNNYLGRLLAQGYVNKMKSQCGGLPAGFVRDNCVGKIKQEAVATSNRLNQEMVAACKKDPTSEACSAARQSANWFVKESEFAQQNGMGAATQKALDRVNTIIEQHNVSYRPTVDTSISNIETKGALVHELQTGSWIQTDETRVQSLMSQLENIQGTKQYSEYQQAVIATDGNNSVFTISSTSRAAGYSANSRPTAIGDIVYMDGGTQAIVTGQNADGTFRARPTTSQESSVISGFANGVQGISAVKGVGEAVAQTMASAFSTPKTGVKKPVYEPNASTSAGTKGSIQAQKMGYQQAKDFYISSGFSESQALAHMKGIDFSKPAYVATLPKGTIAIQYVKPDGSVGNYFAPPGTPASQLGFYSGGRVLSTFVAQQNVVVLKSTASSVIDDWSFSKTTGWEVETTGGGSQYFSPNIKSWENSK